MYWDSEDMIYLQLAMIKIISIKISTRVTLGENIVLITEDYLFLEFSYNKDQFYV